MDQDSTGSKDSATLGFVVIGRNEGERLVACLQSVLPSGAPVVYVDSGSTDGSVERARALGAQVVTLALDVPFTAARARNTGFRRLTEIAPNVRFVQFVDGDCVVADGWVAAAVSFLAVNPDVAIVCGRRKERYPERSIYNRLCDIEWDTPIGDTEACGGDFLARAEKFRSVGGFNDVVIAGEEPELCHRLRRSGSRIHRLDQLMTHHDAAIMRLGQWATRTKRAGYAYACRAFLHWGDGTQYCIRENVRIVSWALLLPAIIVVLGATLSWWFLLLLAAYPAQFARTLLRMQRSPHGDSAAAYCLFVLLGKWPELAGQTLFVSRLLRGRRQVIIEYK
jgi:glycosyltransferase involved in cell wall biosynthesis